MPPEIFLGHSKIGVLWGNCGEPFSAERGVTQGGPLSSLMFNVCVDAVVREWLCQMLDKDATRDGIGNPVAEMLVAF